MKEKPTTLIDEPERRRPRTLFTHFGGINLNSYDSYRILPDSTVQVFIGATHYRLNVQESYQFLRMVGDSRYTALEEKS
jgi:hypothetical protein